MRDCLFVSCLLFQTGYIWFFQLAVAFGFSGSPCFLLLLAGIHLVRVQRSKSGSQLQEASFSQVCVKLEKQQGDEALPGKRGIFAAVLYCIISDCINNGRRY